VPTLEVEGLRIGYERAGDGPPLVLLHGALSDARVWRRQLEDLSDQLTVVAWDAPGHGRSSDPREPFGMDRFAEVLAGLLEGLDLEPAHVLGLSFGGSLALELYRRHPESVRSLILADTYAGWKGSLSEEECAARLEAALRSAVLAPDELASEWLPQLLSAGVAPAVAQELATIMSDSRPAGMRLIGQAMAVTDLRDALPRIRVPTLVLRGGRSPAITRRIAELLAAALPAAQLGTIADAGHMLPLSHREEANRAILEHLMRHAVPDLPAAA